MMKRLYILLADLVGLNMSGLSANAAAVFPYFQTNLVSNLPGLAAVTDANLQNP